MKGIAHFMVGLATTSCFPVAVQRAAQGQSLYFVLGGICGLLPDTLDFKLARYFFRPDIQVAPDPLDPDMAMVAAAVAVAVQQAHDRDRPIDLQLHTIRLGADQWQGYQVTFDTQRRQVTARLAPATDSGPRPQRNRTVRHAPVTCPMTWDYTATVAVDILDGPTLRLEPDPERPGAVRVRFIPWHRRWSHSLVFSLLLGLLGWAVWDGWAGAVMLSAHAAHVLLDQVGHMGGSLWHPFSKKRWAGLRQVGSGDRAGNVTAVGASLLLIFWNLYAQSDVHIPGFNPLQLFFWGAIVPLGLHWLWTRTRKAEGAGEAADDNGRRLRRKGQP